MIGGGVEKSGAEIFSTCSVACSCLVAKIFLRSNGDGRVPVIDGSEYHGRHAQHIFAINLAIAKKITSDS
jgi:hypothetical protein